MNFNVIGLGTMGRQIAALLNVLGLDVTVLSRQTESDASRTLSIATRLLRRRLEVSGPSGAARFAAEPESMSASPTIEALSEDLAVKRSVLARLGYDIEQVEFFTNTSSLRPELITPNAAGLHFFNPVFAVKLVETTLVDSSPDSAAGLLVDRLRGAGFQVVRVRNNPGYIANFVLFQEISAVLALVEQVGYVPDQIDQVLGLLGRSASIFDVIDLIGTDVALSILKNLAESDSGFHVSPLLESAVAAGVLGAKSKSSFRTYLARVQR